MFAMVAAWCKVTVVAFGAVKQLITNSELDVNQRLVTVTAVEARRVPVTIVVLQILHI